MSYPIRHPTLCVDIGGTSTKAGVLAAAGEITSVQSIASRPDVESYFGALSRLICDVREANARESGQKLTEMGVAVAGFLDAERTHLVYNSNLPWLEGFPLRDRLRAAFADLEIQLEIDSNAATMAEYRFGSGQESRRFLCVTSGTGLGVGMTVEGRPLRFAYGCMGDIGHVIVLRDGPLCTCGGRGCAEIMVSAPAVAERYRAALESQREFTLRDVIEAAQSEEARAVALLAATGSWLGLAIASMANIVFPDHIAIAGGLSAAGPLVLDSAKRVFCESACLFARSRATFTQAKLGPMATLIGAAWPFWGEENRDGESRI